MADTTKTDWLAILSTALPVAAAIDFVNSPGAGGVNIFLGTTREETQPDGTSLRALDYEAYGEMALTQFHMLAAQARTRWPVLKLALLHRTGEVKVGEPSVVIAVSTAHRADCFEACRWLIDTLKAEATIWKKEIWSTGAHTWSGERV